MLLYSYFNYITSKLRAFTFHSLRLSLRTTIFNNQKFCVLPTVHLCVLCGSENKQPLFLYILLTDWFL
jgi:hypothetical protein